MKNRSPYEEYIAMKQAIDDACEEIESLREQLKKECELRKRWEIEYYELRDHLRKVIESHEKA